MSTSSHSPAWDSAEMPPSIKEIYVAAPPAPQSPTVPALPHWVPGGASPCQTLGNVRPRHHDTSSKHDINTCRARTGSLLGPVLNPTR